MLPFSKIQGLGNDFLLLDGRCIEVAEELGRLLERDRAATDRKSTRLNSSHRT